MIFTEVRFLRFSDEDNTLVPVARVDDFTSLVFTRSYSSVGSWQMVMPLDSQNVPQVLSADIISVHPYAAGIITKITKTVGDQPEKR